MKDEDEENKEDKALNQLIEERVKTQKALLKYFNAAIN